MLPDRNEFLQVLNKYYPVLHSSAGLRPCPSEVLLYALSSNEKFHTYAKAPAHSNRLQVHHLIFQRGNQKHVHLSTAMCPVASSPHLHQIPFAYSMHHLPGIVVHSYCCLKATTTIFRPAPVVLKNQR